MFYSWHFLFNRIIDPLASRCAKFRFKALEKNAVITRLKYICKNEDIAMPDDAVATVFDLSEGDLRRAITILQSASRMFGKKITVNHVVEIAGVSSAQWWARFSNTFLKTISESIIEEFFKACCSNNFSKLQANVTSIVQGGHSAVQLLSQLHDFVILKTENKEDSAVKVTDLHKAHICIKLAQAEKCLLDGADEYLQLLSAGSFITKIVCN